MARLIIIGCGNPNRCDDGVGPYVVRRLRESLADSGGDIRFCNTGTDGWEVLDLIVEGDDLLIIDAKTPETSPGALFEIPQTALEELSTPAFSLHDFRWDHAVGAARRMGKACGKLSVFLIEAESLDFAIGLSPVVQREADRLVDLIERRLRQGYIRTQDPQAGNCPD